MPDDKKKATLLVVDDEEALRKAIVFDFRRKGYEVFEASNGKEAFEIVKSHKVDVVLSDIRMPGGDGVELLDNIKGMNPMLPVVMLITGFADLTLEDAYDKGADAVFSKPFDRKTLLSAVERSLISQEKRWSADSDLKAVQLSLKIELQLPEWQKAVEAHLIQLGRGGMFVALKENIPPIHSHLAFKLNLEDPKIASVEGQGIVRWSRQVAQESLPTGCGIEFVSLGENERKHIIQLIESQKMKPFLPKA